MKIKTASNGNKVLRLSKSDWIRIGEKAGWKNEFKEKGRAKENDITPSDVDPKELAMGKEVEKEHTEGGKKGKLNDKGMVETKISLDHLEECPDYYTRLKKMEHECEKCKDGQDKKD